METLYEKIVSLCRDRGIKGGKMCTDIGMSKGILTDLKMGRQTSLSIANARKIAAYFGVSVDFLFGEEEKKPLVNGDEELTEYLELLKNRPECRMLFHLTKDATKEDVEAAVRIIEALRKK